MDTLPNNVVEYLDTVKDTLKERGKDYDKGQERSMQKTVEAFNKITGQNLTEQEGWLFMQTLKDVRLFNSKSYYHVDSAIDCIAYAALKAESFNKEV